jgi:hypothetical protein
MSEENNQIPDAENPEIFTGFKKGTPSKRAAGLKAVIESAKQVLKEAGASRGIKALNKLNKKDGFDCPSCA